MRTEGKLSSPNPTFMKTGLLSLSSKASWNIFSGVWTKLHPASAMTLEALFPT